MTLGPIARELGLSPAMVKALASARLAGGQVVASSYHRGTRRALWRRGATAVWLDAVALDWRLTLAAVEAADIWYRLRCRRPDSLPVLMLHQPLGWAGVRAGEYRAEQTGTGWVFHRVGGAA